MIFWVDAQLPPSLVPWLTETFAVEAKSLRFLGLSDAKDGHIFTIAKQANDVVIISKDSDFIELVLQQGTPSQLVWVTCGNLTNKRLRSVFMQLFPSALQMLQTGEDIVEIEDNEG